jgi:hypothetical protein
MALLEDVTPRDAACARLQAESRLIHRYTDEYRELLARGGHVVAVCALVRTHRHEYETLLAARARTGSGVLSAEGLPALQRPIAACHGGGG